MKILVVGHSLVLHLQHYSSMFQVPLPGSSENLNAVFHSKKEMTLQILRSILDKDCINSLTPDMLYLEVGSFDLCQSGVSPEQLAQDIVEFTEELIDQYKCLKKILIGQITKRSVLSNSMSKCSLIEYNDCVFKTNKYVEQLVVEKENLIFCPLQNFQTNWLASDGFHFRRLADQRYANDVLYNILSACKQTGKHLNTLKGKLKVLFLGHSMLTLLKGYCKAVRKVWHRWFKLAFSDEDQCNLEQAHKYLCYIDKLRPNIVVLDIGSFDLLSPNESPTEIAKEIQNLVQAIFAKGIVDAVVVGSILYRTRPDDDLFFMAHMLDNYNRSVSEVNQLVSLRLSQFESHLSSGHFLLYWNHKGIDQSKMMGEDGFHLNSQGIEAYADSFMDALTSVRLKISKHRNLSPTKLPVPPSNKGSNRESELEKLKAKKKKVPTATLR